MKINLCRLFGVEEGEEFILETKDGWFNDLKYKIENNIIKVATIKYSDYSQSSFKLNEFVYIEKIIKLPKKKQFSQDTLNFFKLVDKKWKWIAKDDDGLTCLYDVKPNKNSYGRWFNNDNGGDWCAISYINDSLFEQILCDEEPIRIDDYVER